MFDPGETSLFGVTGGGVLGGILLGILLFVGFEAAASIGEESEDPHRSIPRALIGDRRRGRGLLRADVVRVLDRLRREGRQRGRAGRSRPAPVSEMATLYVGKWFATILELVVILDAMALALAICVVIGRGFFALGRDGLLPAFFAKTSRRDTPWVGNLMVAVGGIGLTLLVFATSYAHAVRVHRPGRASSSRSSRTTSSRPSSSPRRSGRSRSSSSTSSSRSRRFRLVRESGNKPWQYLIVRGRGRDADARLLRRAQPRPSRQLELQLGRGRLDGRAAPARARLVRDRDRPPAGRTSTTRRRTRPSTTASHRSTRRSTYEPAGDTTPL